jgi:hypothetical protein
VAWQVRSPRDGVQDGEADFIIAHPNLGVMIIEVKGGRIHYDANLALWYSRARKDADFSLISTCSEVKRKRVLSVKITNS